MVYAYLRQLNDSSNVAEQQKSIMTYAALHNITIDNELLEYSSVNHAIDDRAKFESFIHSLSDGDIVLTQTLRLLSCHLCEIVKIINCILTHNVELHIVDAQIVINRNTDISRLFPLLNEMTQEKKRQRRQIGRPKGSRSSSKFDILRPKIVELLKSGMSVSAIARELDVSRSSLKDYIESRELRKLAGESWMEIINISQNHGEDSKTPFLICPFEKQINQNQSKEKQ